MLDFIEARQDVWQTLQLTDKPVVLYGMGNGADQIIDWCDSHKIEVTGSRLMMLSRNVWGIFCS